MQKKHKKFALIGTSCVGKTTLLYKLEKKLQNKYRNRKIITVQEAARYYFEKRKVRKPFSYHNQSQIQTLAKKFEKKAETQKPDIILCDRSVLDAIAYIKTMGTRTEVEKLIKKAKKWLMTYNHFFLLNPIGVHYQIDSVRKEDIQLRKAFHTSFVHLLRDLSLPYTLISGSKKQRINKISDIIYTFDI